uniref:Uncharacterized protein n=1 Tax=Cacopsylla melanoneura TaxID=428564 RepID=A0A8D8Y869_9HEMI
MRRFHDAPKILSNCIRKSWLDHDTPRSVLGHSGTAVLVACGSSGACGWGPSVATALVRAQFQAVWPRARVPIWSPSWSIQGRSGRRLIRHLRTIQSCGSAARGSSEGREPLSETEFLYRLHDPEHMSR